MTCSVEGCDRSIRSDNRTGVCRHAHPWTAYSGVGAEWNRARYSPERRAEKFAETMRDPARREIRRQYGRKKNDAHRAFLWDLKLISGCSDCGYLGHGAALDFDHVRGDKLFDLSKAVGRSRDNIEAEVAKCDIVCANCHRIRTYERSRASLKERI